MMNLIDKLLVKLGYTRNNSPTLKAKTKEGNIDQKQIQIGDGSIIVEGNLVIPEKPYSWYERYHPNVLAYTSDWWGGHGRGTSNDFLRYGY
jgi:hypothetical protein